MKKSRTRLSVIETAVFRILFKFEMMFIREIIFLVNKYKPNSNSIPETLCEKQLNHILLRLVLAPDMAEDVIANPEYYYNTVWRKKHSPFAAKAIYYSQNARVIFSHFGKVIRDTLKLYLKRS